MSTPNSEPVSFDFIDTLEQRAFKELTDPPEGIPLEWWPRFTKVFGGLRPHEISVLTASTGAGKTTFCANVSCQGLIAGVGSYICSAEIGNTLYLLHMYSILDGKDYVGGEKWDEEVVADLLLRYRSTFRAGKLVFSKHDDRIDPEELIREITIAQREFGCKVAILDNLQFFMPLVAADRALLVMDETIRNFVRFIRACPIHVILIAHPRKGGVEDELSIKGSSTISQEVSNVLVLRRLNEELLKQQGFRNSDRELKIFKARRRGLAVGQSIFFEFQGGRYTEKIVEYASKENGVGTGRRYVDRIQKN